MMKYFLIFLTPFFFIFHGCTNTDPDTIRIFEEGSQVNIETNRIRLGFDEKMFCKVSYFENGQYLSINDATHPGSSSFPSHFIELDGRVYAEFNRTGYEVTEIDDPHLGIGKRLTLTGTLYGITKFLVVDLFESLPDVAISTCTYINKTDSSMAIDKVYYNYYRLDRQLSNPDEEPNSFHYLQPLNKEWGLTWTNLTLTDSTDENFVIPGSGSNYSGIPFIDVWGAELGMSVFHVEGVPRFLNIKLQVQDDRKVDMGLVTDPENTFGQFPRELPPGGSVSTWKSAVCVHKGDYFNAGRRFGRLLDVALQKEGRKGLIKNYPKQAYEPYWKTWGMNDPGGSGEFTLDQIRDRMDELADFGFRAIMLDDGWQNTIGVWGLSQDKFRQEQDMIDFVKEAHSPRWGRNKNKSFKVYLWFDLLGTDTIAPYIEPLLVRNEDGSYYKSIQSKYALCPSYEGTHRYLRDSLIERIINRWDIDGLYTDWEDQNPLPCFAENHHHDQKCESVEDNYQAFKVMFNGVMDIKPQRGWLSQCACAAMHDVYQYPYYHVEDASDPTTNEQIRWRVRWIKAVRGGTAPAGDGYVDKMDYDRKAGEPAQSVAIGSVITSLRWKVDELGGEDHARKWMDLYFSEELSSGEYLGYYDIAYETPETHVIKKRDGSFYYSFFDDKPFEKVVTLKGLDPELSYQLIQYEDDLNLGEIQGNDSVINIKSKKGNSQGDPVFYYVIKCKPSSIVELREDGE